MMRLPLLSCILFFAVCGSVPNSWARDAEGKAHVKNMKSAQGAEKLPGKAAPPQGRSGAVTVGVLNVRAKPGLRYEVIAQLHRGDRVVVIDEQDDWLGIRAPHSAKAWIAARFVGAGGTITGSRVRVRSGPGLVFTPYALLEEGERVECVNGPRNGWQQIIPPRMAVAWVHRQFVKLAPPPKPKAAHDESVAKSKTATAAEKHGEPKVTTERRAAKSAEVPGKVTEKAGASSAEKEDEKPGVPTNVANTKTPPKKAAAVTLSKGPGNPAEKEVQPGKKTVKASVETSARAKSGKSKPVPPETGTAKSVKETAGFASPQVVPPKTPGEAANKETVKVPSGISDAGNRKAGAGAKTGKAQSVTPPPAAESTVADAPPSGGAPSGAVDAAGKMSEVRVVLEGVLLPLEIDKRTRFATHVLCKKQDGVLAPFCYLKCSNREINLGEWEYREVRVYGTEMHYRGWTRPAVDVDGIQLVRP